MGLFKPKSTSYPAAIPFEEVGLKIIDLNLFVLATRDAHELYRRYGGVESLKRSDKWMARGRG